MAEITIVFAFVFGPLEQRQGRRQVERRQCLGQVAVRKGGPARRGESACYVLGFAASIAIPWLGPPQFKQESTGTGKAEKAVRGFDDRTARHERLGQELELPGPLFVGQRSARLFVGIRTCIGVANRREQVQGLIGARNPS